MLPHTYYETHRMWNKVEVGRKMKARGEYEKAREKGERPNHLARIVSDKIGHGISPRRVNKWAKDGGW